MHIDLKKYKVVTDKKVSMKIVHISDIHYAKNFNLKRLDMLLKKIKMINPNYICITGDLIDVYNITKDSDFIFFKDFIKSLSEICKVIISIGNHEYILEIDDGYDFVIDISWLYDLESDRIKVLDNSIYSDNNISFIGFNPCYDFYLNREVSISSSDNLKLYKLINKSSSNYNILLLHTPFFIFDDDNYKKIKDFNKIDLVLCGHTHGGMIPSFVPGTFGIIAPSKKFFPKNVRGRKKLNGTEIIISSGVTKLSRKSKITFLTDIFGANINEIEIN